MADNTEWVAVDWGTSNLRVWGIAADGSVVFAENADAGMGKIDRSQYEGVLTGLIGRHVPPGTEVVICGMAGARQGWVEAPYIATPADLGRLIDGAVRPESQYEVRILPGVCQRGDTEDVMRGEETQLLGLLSLRGFEGAVIMPGTHSKWVRLEGGRIAAFATSMTGELYDVLGTHSVLRHSLGGDRMGPATEDGVEAGLTAGLERSSELTGLLFRTRAASLLSGRGADWCSGYLSGLLVGAEIGGRRDWLSGTPVPLIGSARLSRLYGAALSKLGIPSEPIDATDATLAGLKAARAQDRS